MNTTGVWGVPEILGARGVPEIIGVPWTYWMSIPLFVAAVLLDLGLLVAYVRKFVITGLARKRRQAERPAAAEPVLVTRREAA